MKRYHGAKRLLPVGVALLLGFFVSSSGNSGTSPNATNGLKASMSSSAPALQEPSTTDTQVASSGQDKVKEEVFPGSRVKLENAIKKARLIVVAKFVDPGMRSFDSPGKTTHSMVKVEVLQVLKGYLSRELSLTFEVYNDPPYIVEKTPEVGQRYIIFINEKATISAFKFLPDSDGQRWQVMELISSAANEHR
jgi:hypothetical protein